MLEDSFLMALHRSLDVNKIIAALLLDVFERHGAVFNYSSRRNTISIVNRRLSSEGFSFLSKTLPRLGKAIDIALAGGRSIDATKLRFSRQPSSKLPKLFGELLNCIFDRDGVALQEPCIKSIGTMRDICYLFYKYEVPYDRVLEQRVVSAFLKTEDDLQTSDEYLDQIEELVCDIPPTTRFRYRSEQQHVVRKARVLLSNLFAFFDPLDIRPKHGPGAVATKQKLHAKYLWTNVSRRITAYFPLDAYFYVSPGHVCDRLQEFNSVAEENLPARIVLVPKDSRGPRLISCEPVDFQWIQQGLSSAIVSLVERHRLTKDNVHFTDQQPNQFGALLGSRYGSYATLDLNEASDRVSVRLVRLLFPARLCDAMEACRSGTTELPNGGIVALRKFAPMGSSLCFPILALSIWAILSAGAPDRYTRERILVYGDDVIVPTAYAENAMQLLSAFGLKINQDKSCTKGFFRESCGVDAYKGVDVTPVRFRTVWSSSPSPESYTSWVAYANSMYGKMYFHVYDYIVQCLTDLYGEIPSKGMNLSCPSLMEVPEARLPQRTRINKFLQKKEYLVWDTKQPRLIRTMDGWSMLLRYFAEKANSDNHVQSVQGTTGSSDPVDAFSVSSYTSRRASILARTWRSPQSVVGDESVAQMLRRLCR